MGWVGSVDGAIVLWLIRLARSCPLAIVSICERIQNDLYPCSINPPSWGGYVGFHSSSSTSSTSTSSSSSSADFGTLPERGWFEVAEVDVWCAAVEWSGVGGGGV